MSTEMSDEELLNIARQRVKKERFLPTLGDLYTCEYIAHNHMGDHRRFSEPSSVVCLSIGWLGNRHILSLPRCLRLLKGNGMGEERS